MALELSPLNERFVAQALAAGLFPTRDALVDRAVDALRTAMEQSTQAARADEAFRSYDDTYAGPLDAVVADDDESRGRAAWDSDAVMRRIFESLAEAGVRTND